MEDFMTAAHQYARYGLAFMVAFILAFIGAGIINQCYEERLSDFSKAYWILFLFFYCGMFDPIKVLGQRFRRIVPPPALLIPPMGLIMAHVIPACINYLSTPTGNLVFISIIATGGVIVILLLTIFPRGFRSVRK